MFNLLALALALTTSHLVPPTHTFIAQGENFLLDGKPFQIRSGEMHYERIPREYWSDRIAKAKAMGCNTICTYVFWNYHEPERGQYRFKGQYDVAAFVKEVQKQGMWVILRSGPYCCAEWEWGGFPYWLAAIPGMKVRQDNEPFLAEAASYMDHLGKELAPLTVKHNGPIILQQVENEYGSFGHDHVYTEKIHQMIVHAGFDCQLYTADGASKGMLEGGTLPGIPAAINFGGGAEGEFAELNKYHPGGPKMNGEFWCGWFDHWGEEHHTTSPEEQAKDLDYMDSHGYGFSFYMVHGGTSFGWMNGANSGGQGFEPDVNSYDYDSPVSEAGDLTPKFYAFRDVIKKYLPVGEVLPEPPASKPRMAIDKIELTEAATLFQNLPKPVRADQPISFEKLGQAYGFVDYRTILPMDGKNDLTITGLQDRAMIFVNGVLEGTLERAKREKTLQVHGAKGLTLDILVENQGRLNYGGSLVNEKKGFVSAQLGDAKLSGWEMYKFPLENVNNFHYGKDFLSKGPTLLRGSFMVKDPADTYVDMRGWDKGNVWVNGHNLGRFWHIGPQQALYLPAPFLKKGKNEIVILDLQPPGKNSVDTVKDPIWGTS